MSKRRICNRVCIALTMGIALIACDATIHEYPEEVQPNRLIVIEPNVDRLPPPYHKLVRYDEDYNRTVHDLPDRNSQPYEAEDEFEMRIIVDIYKGFPAVRTASSQRIERRVVYVPNDALPPQDTLHVWLPEGDYCALAWADYVPKTYRDDWHYNTDELTAITTTISTYPDNPHHRSTAAGQVSFASAPATVPVYLERPSGRYRVIALDYEDFIQTGGSLEGLTVKVIYKQYVSVGYNVATGEPNLFTSTYSFNVQPEDIDYEGKREVSLFGDYIFTSDERETTILADFYFYDADGLEINHCEGVEIPLMRNQETIVAGYFLTRELGEGNDVSIDDDFEGEYVVEID